MDTDKDTQPQPPLPSALSVHPFTLWHRTGRRAKWKQTGTAPTYRAALDLSLGGGVKHGDWLVLETGKNPNDN